MSYVKVEHRINGKTVTANEFAKDLGEEARELVVRDARRRVEGIRCPRHGQTPSTKLVKASGGTFDVKVDSCCDELSERVEKALDS